MDKPDSMSEEGNRNTLLLCVISGFRCEVAENLATRCAMTQKSTIILCAPKFHVIHWHIMVQW